jgi:type IV secretion system protein VirB4
MFDLRLKGAALAICGASSPEDQKLIEQISQATKSQVASDAFVRAFLEAKGFIGVQGLFDALNASPEIANDFPASVFADVIANDPSTLNPGGPFHVAR